MAKVPITALRPLTLNGVEAALLGLLAGGCRLVFAAPSALHRTGEGRRRFSRWLFQLEGTLVQVESDKSAALMADCAGVCLSLAGLDDLCPILVDVSGRLPLHLPQARLVLAPHSPQAAYEAGRTVFTQVAALRGPGVIAGLESGEGEVLPGQDGEEANSEPPLPIHHAGPDDPALLLLGAGPGFEACAIARRQLEAEGVPAAHLHLLQITPFPGAIVAPAVTSARRVLVVEPGGPGRLADLVRSQLSAPMTPFGELPRLAGAPLGPDEVAWRAREVLTL